MTSEQLESDRESQRVLLAWFRGVSRDLPWRRRSDPWSIWVSEVMLQQTQVSTVKGRFEAFLDRFPTVSALATADEDDVVAAWSGLGYYRRARQLHRASQRVVEVGDFPKSAKGWRELPGVGAYTAAAIASIAQGEVIPVLDGNVERVLCRRLALDGDPKRAATRRQLERKAAQLLEPSAPGESNEALMELGATLCRPRAPRCGDCPLAVGCRARELGDPERFPTPRQRRAIVEQRWRAALVTDAEGRNLLFKRPVGATVLPGSWEIPWVQSDGAEGVSRELALHYGGGFELGSEVGSVRHAITYRRLEVIVHEARVLKAAWIRPYGWFDAIGRSKLPTSSLVDKLIAASRERESG